jgi:hypothetical protein
MIVTVIVIVVVDDDDNGCNGSLVTAIKLKSKYKLNATVISLYHIL